MGAKPAVLGSGAVHTMLRGLPPVVLPLFQLPSAALSVAV